MLSRVFALALFVLASPLHAQSDGRDGAWAQLGTVSPEALALDLPGDSEWSAGYRFASGVSLGATYWRTEYDRLTPFFAPEDPSDVLAVQQDGAYWRAGLTGGAERATQLGIVRGGVSALYSYQRDRSVGLRLLPTEVFPDGRHMPADTTLLLREDFEFETETYGERLHIASGVSIGREVATGSKVQFTPAVGFALGGNVALTGASPAEVGHGLAYMQLPVRFVVTERIGVTLDAIIGGRADWKSERVRVITGQKVGFSPLVALTARVDV